VLIVGSRSAGKTTTAERHAGSILRLDRPAELGAVLHGLGRARR
jgi:GTPase SAR1 family protein